MTRKDYIFIAKIIKDNSYKANELNIKLNNKLYVCNGNIIINKDNIIKDLCVMFKDDNKLFSKDRFIKACE